jgi:protein SCO1/2
MKTRMIQLLCVAAIASFVGIVEAQNPAESFTDKVGIEQKLNAQAPLDAVFRDESNQPARLGNYFGTEPVILVLAYYDCPNLCTLVLNATLTSVQDLRLDAGKDFQIVVVSFDPNEKAILAAEKKRTYVRRYARPGGAAGWHFLTGDEPAIRQLARSVGFSYAYDPATKQFAHPSAIMVLTPEGKISRYFAGIEYPPKDLRLALIEAAGNRIGSLTDQLFLFCFHYNPMTGKYGVAIMRIVRVCGCATVFALAAFVIHQLRREHRVSRSKILPSGRQVKLSEAQARQILK